ncbi:hypothetical protein F4780DRAFT_616406 [Xylariomycetidae sp. FL0641]|nr:hypothetical protein F4780DRAFT_616406 [Xylariomycetidae sp. FL0641]
MLTGSVGQIPPNMESYPASEAAYSMQGGTPAPDAIARDTQNIPLVCLICPNNLRFSDISHLLTHVSSKSHLSNYFELSIIRDDKEEAGDALDQFDAWFHDNDIKGLLRLRMAARAQKGTQQARASQTPSISRGRGGARGRGQRNRGSRADISGRGGRRQPSSRLRRYTYDDLEPDDIKDESPDENADFEAGYGSLDHSGLLWNNHFQTSPFPGQPGVLNDAYLSDIADDGDSEKYQASEDWSGLPSEDTSEFASDGTGSLVLKGVVYPGMGGFDAATHDERRKRNQRKDPAVLDRLKVCSEQVTTIEGVMNANLDVQRFRDVYDEPSVDGSVVGDLRGPFSFLHLGILIVFQDEDEDGDADGRPHRRAASGRYNGQSGRRRQTTAPRQSTRPSRPRTRQSRSSILLDSPVVDASPRLTRSAFSRQSQIPIHTHGLPSDAAIYEDAHMHHPNEGHAHGPSGRTRGRQNSRLPGLALRPGNSNHAFTTPSQSLKQPSLYEGKENNHLLLKSPTSSSNPYLQAPVDPIDNNNFNPLFVRPRDGFGFRAYSPYDDEVKSTSTGNFPPINNHAAFGSLHLAPHHSLQYSRSQSGGDDFNI